MGVYLSMLQQLLFPAMVIFLFVGGIFAILIGAALILRGDAILRYSGSMNRWVSTRRLLKPVEIPRHLEVRSIWGKRLLGITFFFGAAISIVSLIRTYDVAVVATMFKGSVPPVVLEMTAQGAKWFLLVGSTFAMVAGAMLVFVPDAFARLAARANHWHSARKYGRDMDAMHLTLDNWVQASPRAAGWIIVVLGAFVVLNLGVMIFGRH